MERLRGVGRNILGPLSESEKILGWQRRSLRAGNTSSQELTLVPDCCFFQLPRSLTVQMLGALTGGATRVREELTGRKAT